MIKNWPRRVVKKIKKLGSFAAQVKGVGVSGDKYANRAPKRGAKASVAAKSGKKANVRARMRKNPKKAAAKLEKKTEFEY